MRSVHKRCPSYYKKLRQPGGWLREASQSRAGIRLLVSYGCLKYAEASSTTNSTDRRAKLNAKTAQLDLHHTVAVSAQVGFVQTNRNRM